MHPIDQTSSAESYEPSERRYSVPTRPGADPSKPPPGEEEDENKRAYSVHVVTRWYRAPEVTRNTPCAGQACTVHHSPCNTRNVRRKICAACTPLSPIY